jgi:hypothetical protein
MGSGRLAKGELVRFAIVLAFAGVAIAQTAPPASQPDCPPIVFTLVGGNGVAPSLPTPYLDNRSLQCETWTVAYEADSGLSGYTVAFQSATGSVTPGTFGAYTGNTVNSSSGFGTAALGLASYCNFASCTSGGTTVDTPWIRISVSGASGTGNIRGVFYGYKTGYTGGTGGGGGSGGGGGGGCSTPCPVVGTAAAGAPPSGDPVQIAGLDGTDIRTIKTSTAGDVNIEGPAAAGSAGKNPVTTGTLNDAGNVLANYAFPDQAQVTLTTATDAVMVAGSAGKLTYVGSFSVSGNASEAVTIQQGTGTNCGSSTVVLAGPYQNVVALALDFTPQSPLHTTVTGDDLCLHFSAAVTAGGVVIYGQH